MPADPRDFRLSIRGRAPGAAPPASADAADVPAPARPPRPWLSVFFDCCRVYQRVYLRRDGAGYDGRCPRCGVRVRFTVGEDGTDARQFIVK